MEIRSSATLAFVYLSAAFALGVVFTLVWQHVIAEIRFGECSRNPNHCREFQKSADRICAEKADRRTMKSSTQLDRKSTRLNSSHHTTSRMPSSA